VDIHQISRLSGISRNNIGILISRHGMTPQGATRQGRRRNFTPADAFRFIVAGHLIRAGIPNDRVAEMTIFGDAIDAVTGEPAEVFPERSALEAKGKPVYLALPTESGEYDFAPAKHLHLAIRRAGEACVVLDASKIASAIDAELAL
jgi:hypothetical protein